MEKFTITQEDKVLIEEALTVLEKNYDGKYHIVGAALRCRNGAVYTGINCDGIHGSCAEFTAMGSAIKAEEREFDTIVAVHRKAVNNLVAPCGNCRQMLFEYCPDIKVILNDENGEIIKLGIKDLLPYAYVELPES